MVQRLCNERGVDRIVTHGWWESFCRRHAEITLRVTAPLSQARAKATDISVINKYFDTYRAPFPSRACRSSKPSLIYVPVYCTCRLTEDKNDGMAKCKNCLEWFHKSCETIPEVVFQDSCLTWKCSQCED